MPSGIYERKPRKPGMKRNVSEESKQAFRENMRKAREKRLQMGDTEKSLAAKVKNAGKACAVRTGRTILKKLPLGAEAGTVVKVSRYRTLTVIDPVPVSLPDGAWEQKFSQTGQITLYGRTTQFSGQCRILWKYEPSMENIMDEPLFEDQGECPE